LIGCAIPHTAHATGVGCQHESHSAVPVSGLMRTYGETVPHWLQVTTRPR